MPQYSGMWTLSQVSQAVKNQTWTGLPPSVVEYLVVAGGGGGTTYGGGGGAGGLLAGHAGITSGSSYFVTVGGGGAGVNTSANGTNGNNSVLVATTSGASTGNIVASGGGGGGYSQVTGNSGGCGGGGGGGSLGAVGGAGVSGQGNAGGMPKVAGGQYATGGGGGAGTIGLDTASGSIAANGGAGVASAISGTVTTYAGGGAGSVRTNGTASFGGVGGGANGVTGNLAGINGTVNTGGGASSAGEGLTGGTGGSGIVIIRYPGTTQFFTGGTLSYANGYVIHTFYANGVLAPTTPTLYANPDYQIARSLRFNSADTTYLGRTPATATNRRTFTWSGWVKRSVIGSGTQSIFTGYWANTDNGYFNICFRSGDDLAIQTYNIDARITTQLFRDPSAWYHIVVAVDTTQTLNIDRVKLYVNGAQVTSFATTGTIAQNTELAVNYNGTHYIGSLTTSSALLNGYQTECYLIDGQQLTPSSFGWTNPTTGVWAPIKFVGTYGTNGFYVNFSDNSNITAATLGADTSGNGNNWTPNNFSVTAGAGNDSLVDSPTLYGTDTGVGGEVRGNYATFSPLYLNGGGVTATSYTQGNLQIDFSASGGGHGSSTISVSSGKWYSEFTLTAAGGSPNASVGIRLASTVNDSSYSPGYTTGSYGYGNDGNKTSSGTATAYGATFTVGDVIAVALDLDAGTLVFYKNGVSQGTAYTGISGTFLLAVGDGSTPGTHTFVANFGQRAFAYTAPSGYKALCTTNLPTPTIGATSATLASKYFDTSIWAGTTNANTAISNAGFKPDFVWIKNRTLAIDATAGHMFFDVLRGVQAKLSTNSTDAETSQSNFLTAFNDSGFTPGTSTRTNETASNYVAWQWKAGSTGVTNTSGSITSSVSASTTAGFSVVTYTGTGVLATIGHGLGVAPSMIIVKVRNAVDGWFVYHKEIGNTNYLRLNTTAASTAFNLWQSTSPSSTVFSVSTDPTVNANAYTYVAYCFAPIAGFSAFGSYTGNGAANGPVVHTGFRPAFVMIKRAVGGLGSWYMEDSTRDTYNPTGLDIEANSATSEAADSPTFDFLSNGFKLRTTYAGFNTSTDTYIYMAFASNPFKYSLAR